MRWMDIRRGGLSLVLLLASGLLSSACGDGNGGLNAPPGTTFVARDFNGTIYASAPVENGAGDLFVGGSFTTYNSIMVNSMVRLNADGTIDGSFDAQNGFNAEILVITPANDGTGDVYVGGRFTTYNGVTAVGIARLNVTGTLDAGFVTGTGFVHSGGGAEVTSIAMATDGSGDVYVGGEFTSYNGTGTTVLVRLNSDGTLDAGFNTGVGFTSTGRPAVASLAVATDASGDVYVAGSFDTYRSANVNNILRVNSDGTRDAGFATGTGFSAATNSIVVSTDASGDVYVGGNFVNYQGSAINRIIRLNSNGTQDAVFNPGTGFDAVVRTIHISGNGSGDLYVGGDFLTYQSTSSSRIVRVNADGTRDANFDVGDGFDGSVFAIIDTPDTPTSGDVYVGGSFALYDSAGNSNFVRVNRFGARN